MKFTSKVLIPNKSWIVQDENSKIGSVVKCKKGYDFFKNGEKITIKDINSLKEEFNIDFDARNSLKFKMDPASYSIYEHPCSSKPFEPVYNLKKRLPLFAKSAKSKSQYCAGYYVIKFRKGWVKSFCPKLITLERYPYVGPFKTEQEMKTMLNNVNKYETA